jgi:Cu(I)/Ag(I) efflux system membrane fusion protein
MNRLSTLTGWVTLIAAVAAGAYWLGTHRHAAADIAAPPAPATAAAPTMPAERKVLYWHDPMVPGQKFDKPGKSPFMDMALVPVYADESAPDAGVSVASSMTSSLGIRTAVARKVSVAAQFEVVGLVAENERASAVVQSRTAGYIEKLYARANFDGIAAGAPVALIYAPEWAGAQAEYLALRAAHAEPALVAAARQRLRLQSIPDDVVAAAEKSGVPETRYTLTAPRGGIVADLAVRDGAMVTPGMTLLKIVSLGDVWIYAEVPETAAAAVAVGAKAEIRLPAYPDQVLRGRVSAFLPQVNPASRTARARVEMPNPRGQLRPGMQVNIALADSRTQDAIVVPQEAVIATGKRTIVILQGEDRRFRPVEVATGREVGNDIEITRGIAEGDKVVASGQFLLDSEASLKSALTRMAPPAAEGAKP